MALVCRGNSDKPFVREQMRATWEQVAQNPNCKVHFSRGDGYAAHSVDYDDEEFKQLSSEPNVNFAAIENPVDVGDADPKLVAIRVKQVVLDYAGVTSMDLLLAARRLGTKGRLRSSIALMPGFSTYRKNYN